MFLSFMVILPKTQAYLMSVDFAYLRSILLYIYSSFHCSRMFFLGAWVAQSVKCLPLAQFMIPGSWGWAPSWAPCSAEESTFPSPSALPSAFFSFQINKIFKKKECSFFCVGLTIYGSENMNFQYSIFSINLLCSALMKCGFTPEELTTQ